MIRLTGQLSEKCDSTDSSVLLFALAGSFGRLRYGSSRLVESGGYFVDVEQGEEGEDQAEQGEKKKSTNIEKVSKHVVFNADEASLTRW